MGEKISVKSGEMLKKKFKQEEIPCYETHDKNLSVADIKNIDTSKLYTPIKDEDRKYKTNYIFKQCLLYISQLPPIDKNNIDTLYLRFNLIREFIINNDFIVGNKMVYYMLDLSDDDIYYMYNGLNGYDYNYKAFACEVKKFCATLREQNILNGDVAFVPGIFHQKVYDGMIEPKVIQVEHKLDNNTYSRDELNKEFDLLLDNIENTKI